MPVTNEADQQPLWARPRRAQSGWWILLALALAFFVVPATTRAQAQPSQYWQFAASGRIEHVVPSDVDQDGIEEFLVADENGRLLLLSADGLPQWDYEAGQPILAIATVNNVGQAANTRGIVLGLLNGVVLLSARGQLVWEAPLSAVTPPPSLLTNAGLEAQAELLERYDALPHVLAGYDQNGDGREEILVLLRSGQLKLIDGEGTEVWQYVRNDNPAFDAQPRLVLTDLDQDDQAEIALAFFGPRRFSELIILDDLEVVAEIAISRRITALTAVDFGQPARPMLAVGTNFGQIDLYDGRGRRQWFRTLNVPVTDLTPVELPQGQALAAATSVGTITTFAGNGRRYWTATPLGTPERPVLSMSAIAFPPMGRQPVIAALMATGDQISEGAEVVLLDGSGQLLNQTAGADFGGLTRLVDINRDHRSELLLTRFATLELVGVGTGTSVNVKEWEYALNAVPTSALVVDFEQDGEDELIVGTADGRIHSLSNDRSIRSLNDPGGIITHLALLNRADDTPPAFVVIRQQAATNGTSATSWIELRQDNGEKVWERELPVRVETLLVGRDATEGHTFIAVGSENDTVQAFSTNNEALWQHVIPGIGGIKHMVLLEGNSAVQQELIVASQRHIFGIKTEQSAVIARHLATFDRPIRVLFQAGQPDSLSRAISLMVLDEAGRIHGLDRRGQRMGGFSLTPTLSGVPTTALATGYQSERPFPDNNGSFLIASNAAELVQLHVERNRPVVHWRLEGLGDVTSLYWDDVDGDGRPDSAVVGSRTGQIRFLEQLNSDSPQIAPGSLELSSSVFAISRLQRESGQAANLLIITENGLVQSFQAQENRPPLLTSPEIQVGQGQSSISVAVRDVEGDVVRVNLELQDGTSGNWLPQGEKELNEGFGSLSWLIANPPGSDPVRYRFVYDDGFYQGYVTPSLVFSPPDGGLFSAARLVLVAGVGIVGLVAAALVIRQLRSPGARAQRFYYAIKQHPGHTLKALESKQAHHDRSQDDWLYLANHARQKSDRLIAALADGLFLIQSRPMVGLSIVVGALDEAEQQQPAWRGLDRWQAVYRTVQAVVTAPTITELSLLRPPWEELVSAAAKNGFELPGLATVQPVLENIHRSERVELAEDRLYYLNEAADLLQQLRRQLAQLPATLERPLVVAVVERCSGLVDAEIEALRGRAELVIALKTRRLIPNQRSEIIVSFTNTGRASATNIRLVAADDPAYLIHAPPKTMANLRPGRTRQLRLPIEPVVSDRFRLALTVTYDDRNRPGKQVAFADMIHVLQPVMEFKPIANPYMPGTPLRRNSALFFGREGLFHFIAENAGHWSQRNVLILVGQRRTGKTSALLRLGQHLSPDLLPVYVDCQSLGVSPGIPALLHELAWLIADAMAGRDVSVDVPDVEAWRANPTSFFQRQFLTGVLEQLPSGARLLLVFDEFEAFESLVDDGILPHTFFTYLRHLMQHSENLGFIFVGTRRLEEMSADYWSVLFNTALYRKIGFLSAEAATRLIREPVEPHLIYDDLAVDKILRVTAGHPYFLQLVCYTLVMRANRRRAAYVTISDVNAALNEMLSLGEVHFAYLWQRSSYAERALLTAVAHLMDRGLPFHPEEMVEYLVPYGIRLSPQDVISALNRLVERDIMREITEEATTLYELKIGLVGLWTAQTKSLSKLYASAEGNASVVS